MRAAFSVEGMHTNSLAELPLSCGASEEISVVLARMGSSPKRVSGCWRTSSRSLRVRTGQYRHPVQAFDFSNQPYNFSYERFAAGQPDRPDPHQDRPAAGADATNRNGRLLTLVRTLIAYGRHMAAALQQRTSATDLADITRHFGTIDIGEIVARITRGLLRAAALEARLISHPIREPATPAALTAPSPREPRAAQPEDESAGAGEPRIVRLPTPGDIAAESRRRPAGAVLADICRDLGIVPSNPLWRQLSAAIISYGGNLATLVGDIADRHGLLIRPPAAPTRGTGTAPAIHGEARHRPALNFIRDHRGVTHGAGPRLVPPH